jgi:sulfite reductase (NADPH) flavoprotein alpha-component
MAIPVLPSSAPFSAEQRAYLNGFFAGMFGLDGAASGDSNQMAQAPAVVAPIDTAVPEEPAADESTPWHDASLALEERIALAEDRPLPMKLMASMAQLDCGQCGYLCKSYAQALADGSEKSVRKCVPGGKETANKLKELLA